MTNDQMRDIWYKKRLRPGRDWDAPGAPSQEPDFEYSRPAFVTAQKLRRGDRVTSGYSPADIRQHEVLDVKRSSASVLVTFRDPETGDEYTERMRNGVRVKVSRSHAAIMGHRAPRQQGGSPSGEPRNKLTPDEAQRVLESYNRGQIGPRDEYGTPTTNPAAFARMRKLAGQSSTARNLIEKPEPPSKPATDKLLRDMGHRPGPRIKNEPRKVGGPKRPVSTKQVPVATERKLERDATGKPTGRVIKTQRTVTQRSLTPDKQARYKQLLDQGYTPTQAKRMAGLQRGQKYRDVRDMPIADLRTSRSKYPAGSPERARIDAELNKRSKSTLASVRQGQRQRQRIQSLKETKPAPRGAPTHAELLAARRDARKKYPAGHPERLRAERAVRTSRRQQRMTPERRQEVAKIESGKKAAAVKQAESKRPLRIAGQRMTKTQEAEFNRLNTTNQDIYEERRQEGMPHAEAIKGLGWAAVQRRTAKPATPQDETGAAVNRLTSGQTTFEQEVARILGTPREQRAVNRQAAQRRAAAPAVREGPMPRQTKGPKYQPLGKAGPGNRYTPEGAPGRPSTAKITQFNALYSQWISAKRSGNKAQVARLETRMKALGAVSTQAGGFRLPRAPGPIPA